ncbi:formyltetrahydrofolate deformylase [Flavihumibacter profundi]|uniref:formyltetrahydrofolate deformylase n=1 Tax=Flavihumibacter profundi TaxID=2716883 RepID=UPI001CC42B57|nr:formyltetrahydrofolate deformylase [Flavihumibacter profundi]MBZ5858684.1 formyltetrahydrofolate deformylase [Flavihumibacter profundi]
MEENHVIRIKCADRKGLIAGISGLLFSNNHNILVMKEFVDTDTETFFTRLEVSGDLDTAGLHAALGKLLPEHAVIDIIPKRKKDIVILVTKEHHCLSDLIVRHYFNELHANIRAVIGNYNSLQPFTDKFNIPYHYISHENRSHEAFEKAITEVLDGYQPDYLILAKFMRILSPDFVSKYPDRIINIHHSFLPAFKGANPYKKAFERGVKLIGATAHIVNNDLDEGPIITQKIIPVQHDDGLRDMVEAGHEIEKAVLADALKMVLEDRIFVSGNKTIIFN